MEGKGGKAAKPCIPLGSITMETIAFYSYKGGVGRSLLLHHCAYILALSGFKIVVLDLDLEAPSLHYKFQLHEKLQGGVVDYLLSVFQGGTNKSILEMAVPVNLPKEYDGSLYVVPAGSAPSADYWQSLAELRSEQISGHNTGLLEAILELQAQIAETLSPDYLLVDVQNGVSALGGLATTAMADRVALLTTLDLESLEGTKSIAEALTRTPRIGSDRQRVLHFIVSRVQRGESQKHKKLKMMFSEWTEFPDQSGDNNIQDSTPRQAHKFIDVSSSNKSTQTYKKHSREPSSHDLGLGCVGKHIAE